MENGHNSENYRHIAAKKARKSQQKADDAFSEAIASQYRADRATDPSARSDLRYAADHHNREAARHGRDASGYNNEAAVHAKNAGTHFASAAMYYSM